MLVEILSLIARAEYQSGKAKQLLLIEANQTLDTIKILVRLANTLEIIQEGDYLIAETAFYEIGKMLGGWIRSL